MALYVCGYDGAIQRGPAVERLSVGLLCRFYFSSDSAKEVTMATDLRPLIAAKLADLGRPISERIMKWRFFNAQQGIETTAQDGSTISMRGVKYAGTVPQVFWTGFFEPFMVEAASQTLQWVANHCRDCRLDPQVYIEEARLLLHEFVATSYLEIAKTDQLLRGGGFPDTITPKDVSGKTLAMCDQVDRLARAYLLSGPPGSAIVSVEDIIELKPNIWGIGININAAWRRVCSKLQKRGRATS